MSLWKIAWQIFFFFAKLYVFLLYNSTIVILGTYPNELKINVQKKKKPNKQLMSMQKSEHGCL